MDDPGYRRKIPKRFAPAFVTEFPGCVGICGIQQIVAQIVFAAEPVLKFRFAEAKFGYTSEHRKLDQGNTAAEDDAGCIKILRNIEISAVIELMAVACEPDYNASFDEHRIFQEGGSHVCPHPDGKNKQRVIL